ncbi:heavy-metal-associated domain-containing protein [Algimonas porphyrae]|uniref:Heavy-metal-associated domain-containing protein n=1 Tax=Algimonas porphyrae TaxID=1128113 RepID=A0ABQ5V244_9PROT|nr:hypothetical protein [Algimonas porphyrae]GLQ21032.1 hypothetical protein GCM10007854_19870 [Algimonas porphyrae]
MKLILSLALSAALAAPVLAQVDHSKMDHAGMEHADHDHTMDGEAVSTTMGAHLSLAVQPELMEALAAGGQPVVATVLGAVCDFCAMAMNKTFGKRDEVSAVYVDLDEKTLNLVLKADATMDDATLTELVKRAGYKVDRIDRAPILSGT